MVVPMPAVLSPAPRPPVPRERDGSAAQEEGGLSAASLGEERRTGVEMGERGGRGAALPLLSSRSVRNLRFAARGGGACGATVVVVVVVGLEKDGEATREEEEEAAAAPISGGGGRAISSTSSTRKTPTVACRAMETSSVFSATSSRMGTTRVSSDTTDDGRANARRRAFISSKEMGSKRMTSSGGAYITEEEEEEEEGRGEPFRLRCTSQLMSDGRRRRGSVAPPPWVVAECGRLVQWEARMTSCGSSSSSRFFLDHFILVVWCPAPSFAETVCFRFQKGSWTCGGFFPLLRCVIPSFSSFFVVVVVRVDPEPNGNDEEE